MSYTSTGEAPDYREDDSPTEAEREAECRSHPLFLEFVEFAVSEGITQDGEVLPEAFCDWESDFRMFAAGSYAGAKAVMERMHADLNKTEIEEVPPTEQQIYNNQS